VGCGTGHWLAGLRPVSAQLYGLDLSAGMLAQAQQREGALSLVRGRAGQIPLPDASIDLVCCVNAIHHFQQQPGFVAEARRVLHPGGVLAVIGMDPRAHRDRWYLYDYFPGTYETDLARFPSWGTVLDWMAASGFQQVEWRFVEQIVDHKVGRSVLDDPYLQKEAVSQLTLLSDTAYAAGLARIETALTAAEAAGETLTFPTDLLLAMLAGWVPG
jgi:SAM-dependent methyltransferase